MNILPPSCLRKCVRAVLLAVLLDVVASSPLFSAVTSAPTWIAAPGARVTIGSSENGATQLLSAAGTGEFTIESLESYPATPGDSFKMSVRIKGDLYARALPELVCYDAGGREIPISSSLARGNPFVTTDWRSLQNVFAVRPGTASVRARIRGMGTGTIFVTDFEFGPTKVDAYATGALVTPPHAKRRLAVVLESNFGIVDRDLITNTDRDGDGKWALVTVNLDELTAPTKAGEDWRTGFEDNPNEILWSDGAVLKSDTVHADRPPDRGKALHYHTKVHSGPYSAKISDPGRAVAISLDGQTWKRYEGGEEIDLGTLAAADGVIEFWLDACYRDPVSVGPAYFDYVRLLPLVHGPSIDQLFAASRKKPAQVTLGSVDERKVAVVVDVPSLSSGVAWPARCGLPIPRGELVSAENVKVVDAVGATVPSQVRVMARWPDGSARWIFADFMHLQGTGRNSGSYAVHYGNRVKTEAVVKGVQIRRTDTGMEVDTGAIQFSVSAKRFGLIENVRLAGGKVVQAGPMVAEIVEAEGRTWQATAAPVTKLEIEQAGPLHTVILVATQLAESGKPSAGFHHSARIHAYAGSPLVEIDYFVANTDSRSVGPVPGSMASKVAVKSIAIKLQPSQVIEAARHALGSAGAAGALVQKTEEDVVLRGGEQAKELRARVPGWVSVATAGGGSLQVGVADFRESFPKALRWSPREVEIALWADEGGVYDWIEGVGKTHHLALRYGSDASTAAELLSRGPLLALAAPEWYARSGAMGRIDVANSNLLPEVEETLARHIKETAIGRVGLGFENYGDHSSNGYVKGTFLWDNNEYDLPAGCMVHFARTGDRDSLRTGLASALHYLDVDVIHYSSQHAEWAHTEHTHSHGTVGHHTAQGPDMHHAGYAQGLIWYSYFTGEPVGILGAQGIADWVLKNLGLHTQTMERLLGHPLMTLNDVFEATGDERYLRGSAHLVDQALKWENPVRSGFPSPVTESPAYYAGCPFNAGMTFSALMKFNAWANLAEVDGMLERLAGWVLTDVWLPPTGLQSKGGSPRRKPSAQHIANHGRLMAHVYERTHDPMYLVMPQEMVAAGFGEGGHFGPRATGLVYNYLPWFLATLSENGNPQPDPQLEINIAPVSCQLSRGGKTSVEVTLKNNGTSAVEGLHMSLHARLDIGIVTPAKILPAVLPGQTATYHYEVKAPADLNASCAYNCVAYVHLNTVYRRGGNAHGAHRWFKLELDSEKSQPASVTALLPATR